MFEQDTHKIETEQEKQWLDDSTTLNVRPNQIKNLMDMKYGKSAISTKHIRYMQTKLKKSEDMERDDLATALQLIEDEGGNVEVLKDKNQKVRVLVVQTVAMKKAYLGVNPEICQVDTTFRFETSGYKMTVFMYLNPVTNRGEVAQIAFLNDEGAEAYEFAFRAFKKFVRKDPPSILLDKDFNEIAIIRKVFPSSATYLCIFHVLKWWKGLVKTARTDNECVGFEEKKRIMDQFRAVLYATSESSCEEEKGKFLKVIHDVQVRVGNGDQAYHVDLVDYFVKNWGDCESMWILYYRKHCVGLEEEFTNNRIERFWRSIKFFLKGMSSGDMTIIKAVRAVVRFAEDRMGQKYVWDQRHTLRMYDADPEVKEEFLNAGKVINDRGVQKFKESVNMMRSRAPFMEIVIIESGKECVKEIFKKPSKQKNGHDAVQEDGDPADVSDENDADELVDVDDKKVSEEEAFKIYKCDLKMCTCSWSVRSGTPCRHVLLFRKSKGLLLFDVECFDQRFMKIRNQDLIHGVELDNRDAHVSLAPTVEDDPVYDEATSKSAMNRGDKYRIIGPLGERLMEAMLRRGTRLVEQYSTELEICINNVKHGRSLFYTDSDSQTEHENHSVSQTEPKIHTDSQTETENETLKSNEDLGTEARKKFDLEFNNSTNLGKVGRPRDSKTKFVHKTKQEKKSKKAKKLSSSTTNPEKTKLSASSTTIPKLSSSSATNPKSSSTTPNPGETLICSYPANPERIRQNGICQGDLKCLSPRSFVSIQICDFKLRQLQSSPEEEVVWILSNELAQQLSGRYWEAPRIKSQLEKARLYEDGGCKVIFLPWCEKGHFFSIIAVLGPQDRIYIMESIGAYDIPAGAGILEEFIKQVRARRGWDPVDCIISILDSPKQVMGSNNCAFFMLENAITLLRDPEDFCSRAENDNMLSWYDGEQVGKRRPEMLDMLLRLGVEQREAGGPLQFEKMLDLKDLSSTVS